MEQNMLTQESGTAVDAVNASYVSITEALIGEMPRTPSSQTLSLDRSKQLSSQISSSESLENLANNHAGHNDKLFAECMERAVDTTILHSCRLLGETTKTLELALLFDHMSQMTCSRLGKELLSAMMTSPSSDAATIQDMQQAIAEIAKHPEGTTVCKALVTSAEKSLLLVNAFKKDYSNASISSADSSTEAMLTRFSKPLKTVQESIEETRALLIKMAGVALESPSINESLGEIHRVFFSPDVDDILALAVPKAGEVNFSVGYRTEKITDIQRSQGDNGISKYTTIPALTSGAASLPFFAFNNTTPGFIMAGIGVAIFMIGGFFHLIEWPNHRAVVHESLSKTTQAIAAVFNKAFKETALPAGIAYLDYCQANAAIGKNNSDSMTMPVVTDAERLTFHHRGIRNPLMVIQNRECVPNDFEMRAGNPIIITGPNSGGKSMICRSLLINQVLTQMGAYIYADEAYISPAHSIAFQVPAQNSVTDAGGRYASELKSTLAMLEMSGERSFTVLDEMTQGTESKSGRSTAKRLLGAFAAKRGGTILVTHDLELAEELKDSGVIQAYQLEYDGEDPTHKIIPGVAESSHSERVDEQLGATEEQILNRFMDDPDAQEHFSQWMDSTR